jgi:hypothetical protein
LKLHGIKAVEIHGKVKPRQRTAILKSFQDSGVDDARVLVMSNVGTTGLNLQCANIMVVMVRHPIPSCALSHIFCQDTLWSAQEDNQLIGRIWRFPQSKDVHIYRLIAMNTQDIFLNNISFDKAAIHNAFTGSTPNMRRLTRLRPHYASLKYLSGALFESTSDESDSTEAESSTEEQSDTRTPKNKSKKVWKTTRNPLTSSKAPGGDSKGRVTNCGQKQETASPKQSEQGDRLPQTKPENAVEKSTVDSPPSSRLLLGDSSTATFDPATRDDEGETHQPT